MGDGEVTSHHHRRPPLPLDFLDQRRIVIHGSVDPGGHLGGRAMRWGGCSRGEGQSCSAKGRSPRGMRDGDQNNGGADNGGSNSALPVRRAGRSALCSVPDNDLAVEQGDGFP